MDTWVWLLILAIILVAWWLWAQYGATYLAIKNNPNAVHAGQSVARYVTDIEGIVGAYQAANDVDGSFMSRMGAFFGALPT
jgi:hypothetical protein